MLGTAVLTAPRRGGWHQLPREARDTLFLLAVIAWVAGPHASHLPLWCTVMTGGLIAWRAVLAFQAKPLPGRAWRMGLLAAAAGATFYSHGSLLGRDAGVTLIVVLLAMKTLELRARRDAFVVFFLGFFTLLTNFFFSQSLLVAAAMLLGLWGLLTALVNAHLPLGKPPLWQAARTAGSLALLGAPVMVVLFVLFPRVAPLWGLPNDATSSRSGLSANMRVGNVAQLALDDSIALRVRFEGAAPTQQQLYFRGPVLSRFDGVQWTVLTPQSGSRFESAASVAAANAGVGPAVSYEVTLEPNNRPWLLTLDITTQPPTLPSGWEAFRTSELQWTLSRPVTDLLRYQVQSHVGYRLGPFNASELSPLYRELPLGYNPRTGQLAAEIRAANGGASAEPAQLVRAALQRLRTGGYVYTLEPGLYGTHTADEFWFDRKQGFCEHIASAFVVLMRGMGVPARVVTGYQGGERNAVDGYWVVRQSDAHAWAEVWLGAAGWTRIDPTAAVAPSRIGALQRLQAPRGFLGNVVDTVNPSLAANLRAAWEAANNHWNQWVLNYTQSKQLDLLRNLGFSSPSWEDLGLVLLGVLAATSALAASWLAWERSQHDPWLRLLARVRKRLQAAGLDTAPQAGPRQLAQAVQARFGPAGDALAVWLLKLEATRYAPTPGPSLAALRRQWRQLPWPQGPANF